MAFNTRWVSILVRAAVVAALAAQAGAVLAQADPEKSERWPGIRKVLFDARPINANGGEQVQLFIPKQAEDAAVVPVMIRTRFEQTPQRYVKNVYLVIDNNPSPISAAFHFTPESGRADIETRVRVETYSPVRAIAEMSDGELVMTARTIIASGGCSAPALKDAAQLRNMGKIKFRLEDDTVEFGRPNMAQVMINHPNWSGLAMNETTVQFIKKVNVFYGEKLVMSADVDFSISENPNFRFYFVPQEKAQLKVEMVDSADLKYVNTLDIGRPGAPDNATASRQ